MTRRSLLQILAGVLAAPWKALRSPLDLDRIRQWWQKTPEHQELMDGFEEYRKSRVNCLFTRGTQQLHVLDSTVDEDGNEALKWGHPEAGSSPCKVAAAASGSPWPEPVFDPSIEELERSNEAARKRLEWRAREPRT